MMFIVKYCYFTAIFRTEHDIQIFWIHNMATLNYQYYFIVPVSYTTILLIHSFQQTYINLFLNQVYSSTSTYV